MKNSKRVMQKVDVIIPVGLRDCWIVSKTITYVQRNIDVNIIYLITSSNNKKFLSKSLIKFGNVQIVDEDLIIEGLSYKNVERIVNSHFFKKCRTVGWYFQQFLKIGFSRSALASNDYYLVWDADTIPTKRIAVFEDGKMIFTIKSEYHKPYFDAIEKLLSIPKKINGSFIAEHMVVSKSIMRDLITRIESSAIDGDSWIEKILLSIEENTCNGFSEFETYGTFCAQNYPESFVMRSLITFRNAGMIYGRGITSKQIEFLALAYDTISLELRHIPPFPKSIRNYFEIYFFALVKGWRTMYLNIIEAFKSICKYV